MATCSSPSTSTVSTPPSRRAPARRRLTVCSSTKFAACPGVSKMGKVVGFDLVEVNPMVDHYGQTSGEHLILEFLVRFSLRRQPGGLTKIGGGDDDRLYHSAPVRHPRHSRGDVDADFRHHPNSGQRPIIAGQFATPDAWCRRSNSSSASTIPSTCNIGAGPPNMRGDLGQSLVMEHPVTPSFQTRSAPPRYRRVVLRVRGRDRDLLRHRGGARNTATDQISIFTYAGISISIWGVVVGHGVRALSTGCRRAGAAMQLDGLLTRISSLVLPTAR